jgi:hypothetical protein
LGGENGGGKSGRTGPNDRDALLQGLKGALKSTMDLV